MILTSLVFLRLISFCSGVTYCVASGANLNKLFFGTGTKLIIGKSKKENIYITFINNIMKVVDFDESDGCT